MIVLGIDPLQEEAQSTLCAYLAGLIDGEGYVGIKRRVPSKANRMTTHRYSATVSISMTDAEPIYLIADFCASRHLVRTRTRGTHKPIHEFQVEYGRAEMLLRRISPYLIVKKRAALLALALCDRQKEASKHRTKVAGTYLHKAGPQAGKPYRVFAQSDDYVSGLESLYQSALVGSPKSGNGSRFDSSRH